jgi:Tfp pilus assembly protein PilW
VCQRRGVVLMFLATLQSLTTNEDRSQRLVSNEQNVRFELDQLARDIRAANPLTPC